MQATNVEPRDDTARRAARRRPGRRAVGFVALALVAIAAIWHFWRPRTLLDRSTAITSTAGWCLMPDMYMSGDLRIIRGSTYDWLSDRRILCFLGVIPPRVQQIGNTFHVWSGHGGVPHAYDVAARHGYPLVGLSVHLQVSPGPEGTVKASQDGRWILWDDYDGTNTATVDGRHHRIWAGDGEFYWLGDSRHFIEIVTREDGTHTTPIVYDLEDPRRRDVLPLPVDLFWRHSLVTAGHRLLGLSASGDHVHVVVADMDAWLKRKIPDVRKYSFRLPRASALREWTVSTDGTHVAWLVKRTHEPLLTSTLHRIIPGYPVSSISENELWISRLDGSDMRLIGAMPCPSTRYPADSVFAIRWIPGNRSVSFVYHDMLWSVPTD